MKKRLTVLNSCVSKSSCIIFLTIWALSSQLAFAHDNNSSFEDHGGGDGNCAKGTRTFQYPYQKYEMVDGNWKAVDEISPLKIGEERAIEIRVIQPKLDSIVASNAGQDHVVTLAVINSKEIPGIQTYVNATLLGEKTQTVSLEHSAVFTYIITGLAPGKGKVYLNATIDHKNYGLVTENITVLDQGYFLRTFKQVLMEEWKYFLGLAGGLIALASKNKSWFSKAWAEVKSFFARLLASKKQKRNAAT